jgi:cephalosporin hydroxylase
VSTLEACALDVITDIEASVAAYPAQWQGEPMVKIQDDIDRYERIITHTRPDLIIETGTWTGESALWFADMVPEVVTVDIEPAVTVRTAKRWRGRVTAILGHSLSDSVLRMVEAVASGRRTMVVLDSDHTAHHVAAEIQRYGRFVTPGCYLVVEDGICRWVDDDPHQSCGPFDALESFLPAPGWVRDTDIETLSRVTMNPAGWLVRERDVALRCS